MEVYLAFAEISITAYTLSLTHLRHSFFFNIFQERCAYVTWNHKRVYMCFCKGDLCNSAPKSFTAHTGLFMVKYFFYVKLRSEYNGDLKSDHSKSGNMQNHNLQVVFTTTFNCYNT